MFISSQPESWSVLGNRPAQAAVLAKRGPQKSQAVKAAQQLSRQASQTLGIQIIPNHANNSWVTVEEMRTVIAALRKLPAKDLALLLKYGINIELLPTTRLSGLGDTLLGATRIVEDATGTWVPTGIKIATKARMGGEFELGEVVQHEVGHVIAVIRAQDKSEEAADRYAARY